LQNRQVTVLVQKPALSLVSLIIDHNIGFNICWM